jgi:hypothetical protein
MLSAFWSGLSQATSNLANLGVIDDGGWENVNFFWELYLAKFSYVGRGVVQLFE